MGAPGFLSFDINGGMGMIPQGLVGPFKYVTNAAITTTQIKTTGTGATGNGPAVACGLQYTGTGTCAVTLFDANSVGTCTAANTVWTGALSPGVTTIIVGVPCNSGLWATVAAPTSGNVIILYA